MYDLESGETSYLTPMREPRWHFSGSCYDTLGWAVVSTYYPEYPKLPEKWGDHEVFMVELTKRKNPLPMVWRIAHTRSVFKKYSDAPFAKINKKGTKIWFGAGWGNSYQDGSYDVYQIDLPKSWFHDLTNIAKTRPLSSKTR